MTVVVDRHRLVRPAAATANPAAAVAAPSVAQGVWAYRLALLALLAYLALGAPALTTLGIPYSLPYGSYIYKFHPGSYLMAAALLLSLLADGNPLAVLLQRLRAMPLLAAYLAGVALACAYSLARHGASGAAFYIDALVMPAVAILVLCRFDRAQLRGALRLVFAMLLLNTMIALGEAALGRTLIPLNIGGKLITFEGNFRATALLGHPLENGLITSVMLLAMLDLPLPAFGKAAAAGLFLLALLAFGGRTSVLLCSLALLLYGGRRALAGLRQGRHGYLVIVGAAAATIFVLPAAAVLLWESGLGDRVFEGLYLDNSASVRLRIYRVFDFITPGDLLFGLSPEQVVAVSARIGLDPTFEAIENFWLLMLLQLGLPIFVAFACGLLSGLYLLWRRSGPGGRWAVLVFLATASTTNSLASKTAALTMLFSIVFCTAALTRQGALSGKPR